MVNRYDIKGFICSNKTPEVDKALYRELHSKALGLLAKGQAFLAGKEERMKF